MNITQAVKRNVNIPNMLTLVRIAVIIPTVKYILEERYIYAGVFLCISALSDMFDGMAARRFGQITQLGKILDPIADKLTLIAVVLSISQVYPYVYPFVTVMLLKEMIMLTGGFILLKKRIRPPSAKWYGKAATAVFYVSVIVLVLLRAVWGISISWLSASLFGLSTGFMMFALMNYVSIFLKLMKENSNKGENKKFL